MTGGAQAPEARGAAGQVVVVTGASRGLGAALAAGFLARGLTVAACARTVPEPPGGADPARWMAGAVDVTQAGQVDAFAAATVARFGRIDAWVTNAGVLAPIGPLADDDPGELAAHVATNVLGAMHGAAAFARHVRTRPGGGALVAISSGAATSPYQGWAPYCASKAAVEMLTEVVGLEEAAHGLRTYAVAPGVLDTGMQAEVRAASVEDFPAVGRFLEIHASGRFTDMDWVAACLVERCLDPATRLVAGDGAGSVRFRVPDAVASGPASSGGATPGPTS